MPELPIPEERGAAQALSGASHTRQVLAALVSLAADLSSSLEWREVLDLALQRAIELMQAEAGAILILAEDGQTLVCEAQISRGVAIFASGQQLSLAAGIAGRVAQTGRLYYTNMPAEDPCFSPAHDQCAGMATKSLVCAPLRNRGRLLGVMQVRNRLSGQFTEDEAHLFQAFADLAAAAIANSRLHAESLARRRLEREMSLARQIQQSFLPKTYPAAPGLRFEAAMEPAAEVGGDFYDIFSVPDGRLAVAVGDVSGKGTAAALYMACLHAELHLAMEFEADPAAVMSRLNRLMFKRSRRGAFISLLLAIFDPANCRLALLSAGHYPPLLYSPQTGAAAMMECATAYPLGVVEEQTFVPVETALVEGAGLLCYTDGTFEAQNAAGEEFGLAQLTKVFALASRERRAFGPCLREALSAFGATALMDDMAFIALWREK